MRSSAQFGRAWRFASSADRAGPILCWIVLLLCLAPYAALIGSGHWATDEFFVAMIERHDRFLAVIDRMRGWSPRPFSETVMAVYFRLADLARRPLVVPFLAAGWIGAVAAVAWAGVRSRLAHPVLLAVALLVAMLLLGRPDELFYWPMATSAYLSAWAGLAVVTVLLLGEASAPLPLTAALLVAALSAEAGAMAVAVAGAVMLAYGLLRRQPGRSAAIWLLPLLAAASVCLSVGRHRMAMMAEVMDHASGFAGHWPASLRGAVAPFLGELGGVYGVAPFPAVLIKLAVILGLPGHRTISRETGRTATWPIVLWTASILVACYATVALSLHQFGTVCCVRHAALRQGLSLIAGLGLCSLLPFRIAAPVRVLSLSVALLVLLAIRMPALRGDLALLPAQIAARDATWNSGEAPGETMRYLMAPPGALSGGATWPARLICLPAREARLYGPESIAGYFRKRVLVMVPWAARDRPVQGQCPAWSRPPP